MFCHQAEDVSGAEYLLWWHLARLVILQLGQTLQYHSQSDTLGLWTPLDYGHLDTLGLWTLGHPGTVDTLGLWTPWDCGQPGTVDSLTRNQCTVCVYSTVQTERSPVPTMAPLTVQSSSVFITESHNKGDLQTRRLHSPLANINQSINCLKLFRLLPRPLLSNISISLNIYFKLCQLQFLHWLDVLNFWAIWKSFTYVHLHM